MNNSSQREQSRKVWVYRRKQNDVRGQLEQSLLGKKVGQNDRQIKKMNLDLRRWSLLGKGGAYWIFSMKSEYIQDVNVDKEDKINRMNKQQSIKISKQQMRSKQLQMQYKVEKNKNSYYHQEDKQKVKQHQEGESNKYEQGGKYVMRMKQINWLSKLIKTRAKLILSQINSNANTHQQQSLSHNQISKELQKEQHHLSQLQLKPINPLTQLVQHIYQLFLNQLTHQSNHSNLSQPNYLPHLSQPNYLPLLSEALVRQSQRFYFSPYPSMQSSQSYVQQTIQVNLDIFIQFLVQQLLFNQIQSSLSKTKQQSKRQLSKQISSIIQQQISLIIQQHLKTYPLNFNLITSLFIKQNPFLTFQSNLLLIPIQHTQSNLNIPQQQNNNYGQQCSNLFCKVELDDLPEVRLDSLWQVILGQVFEFKPKTILPDIYSQVFINQFVQKYQETQTKYLSQQKLKYNKKLKNNNNKQIQKHNSNKQLQKDNINKLNKTVNPLPRDNLSSGNIKNYQLNLLNKIRQQQRQQMMIKWRRMNTIRQIKSSIGDGWLDITSLRWFKKNCLLQKKKNQNPLQYFSSCLNNTPILDKYHKEPQRNNNHKDNINYYSKKHLRRQQLLNLNQLIEKPNNNQTYSKSTYFNQLQIDKVKPRDQQQISKLNNSLLNQQIVKYLSKKHFIPPIKENVNPSYKKQKQSSSCTNISQVEYRQSSSHVSLSLVQQILALQLIDLIDLLYQDKHYKQTKQTEYYGTRKYLDIIQIQQIYHLLTQILSSTSLPKQTYSTTINHFLSQLESLHFKPIPTFYPSNAFSTLKQAFHPYVYQKSKQLSQLLKSIIFQSHTVNTLIQQLFQLNSQNNNPSDQSTIPPDINTLNQLTTLIKFHLFYLTKFLITLTWKDISLMTSDILTFNIQRQKLQQFNFHNHQNVFETSLIKTLNQKRQIINCKIIDYNIKKPQNIDKNVQKDHQFLLYFLRYKYSLQNHQINKSSHKQDIQQQI